MLRNVASNWSNVILSLLATAFLLPFSLRHVGSTAYGTWLVVSAMSAYIYLLHLGLPTTLVRNYSIARAKDDEERMRVLVTNNLAASLAAALVAMLSLPLLDLYLASTLALDKAALADARFALVLSVLTGILNVLWQTPHAIIHAYQKFIILNVLRAAILVVRLVATIVFIPLYPSIVTLAILQVSLSLVETIVLVVFAARLTPFRRLSFSDVSIADLRQAIKLGIHTFLLSMGTILILQTSTVIVGARLGPQEAAFYSIPTGLIWQFFGILFGISDVIMPVAANLHERGRHAELKDIFFRWSKISIALTFLAATGLVLLGPTLVRLWLGEHMMKAGEILQISILGMLVFLPARGAAVPFLIALNNMSRITKVMILGGVTNAILCYILVGIMGVRGAAVANVLTCWCLGLFIFTLTCRTLEISTGEFFLKTFLKPTLALLAMLGLGALLVFETAPLTWIGFLAAGFMVLAIYGVIWLTFVLRQDHHVPLPSVRDITRYLRKGGAAA